MAYHQAMMDDTSRREAFFEMGDMLEKEGNLAGAVVYFQAAMAIPFTEHGYLNSMTMYGNLIPDRLAFTYARMGNQQESKRWWLQAMANNPEKRMLINFPYYYGYDLPRVSIVVPVVREDGFRKLVDSIRADDTYKNYEIIEIRGEGTAIEKFNRGVEQAQGKFIVFRGNPRLACAGIHVLERTL
jgi:tetratricopeptide (TPR) repeat protein